MNSTGRFACLECLHLAPFTCARHVPTSRPPRWTPAAPTLPPVPPTRAAAVVLRDARARERTAMLAAGFADADVVALTAAIDFYDRLIAASATTWPIATDDGDHDLASDPAA